MAGRGARARACAAARHDHVDGAVEAAQHGADRRPVGRGHELDGVLRQAGLAQPGGEASVNRRGAAVRVGPAAQDHRIARLEAERAGVGGDIGAALEYDANHAERRAHALDF